jgi:hypothetical protein
MGQKVIVLRDDGDAPALKVAKVAAIALAGAAVLGGLGVWLARDQMARHQRELFSPQPLRRLAALGYLRAHPGVDNVLLLRDYLAWEDKPLLRKRASAILAGMEEDLAAAEGA